jgi:heme oxygenase
LSPANLRIDVSQSEATARFRLKDATRDLHGQVDTAFARFDLAHRSGYLSFLLAHAQVVPGIERIVDQHGGWSGWTPGASALCHDIADLDGRPPAPSRPIQVWEEAAVWGLQYVLEGSKLGGAVLVRQVGAGLPRRYLERGREPGRWLQFQAELEQARRNGGSAWDDLATNAARNAFHLFRQAACQKSGDLSGR